MPVPFSFGAATTAIPLSQLDSNFNTPITLGNTAIQLGNTVTTLNNMTLANVTISSGNVTITNVTVTTANATTVNTTTLIATTANVTTGNVTNLISGNVSLTGGNITSTAISGSTGSFTTLTTSNTVTINGGTANGVAYLDASKVLTTGSALTFDGSALGVAGRASLTGGGLTGSGNGMHLYFDTGSNTGFIKGFHSGVDDRAIRIDGLNLQFAVAGSEGMRLTSTGLGIGTSSPFAKLQVVAASADYFNPQVMIGEASNSTGKQLHVGYNTTANTGYIQAVHNGTGYKDLLLQPNGGNLGLGVTPSANQGQRSLNVGNYNGTYTAVTAGASGNGYGAIGYNVGFTSTTNSYKALSADYMSWINFDSGAFKFFQTGTVAAGSTQTGTQAMTLDASGRLFVGTTSGATKLDVRGTSNTVESTIQIVGNTVSSLLLGQNADGGVIRGQGGNNALTFWTGGSGDTGAGQDGTERARIDSSGNFLVNTTATVGGASRIGVLFAGNATNGINIQDSTTTSGSAFIGFSNSSGTTIGSVTRNGTTNAVLYNTTSDYRLKEQVQPIENGLAKVLALRPVTWVWKDCEGAKGEGFIAHEVQELIPSAVSGEKDAVNEDGSIKAQGMDASYLVATLTAAIQEQQALITQLTKRITALEGK